MSKKVISLLLVIMLVFSVSTVGCKEKEADNTLNPVSETAVLKPLSADGDNDLWNNPDRGFRTEFVIMVRKTQGNADREKRTVYVDESEEQIRKDIQSVFDIYIYSKSLKPKLALSYIYITDWRGQELDENLLRFFDIYFTMCREQGIKNMLRVSYCDSHTELDRGADEQTIIRHIKQLKGTIAKHADTIHTIECGWVGAYGEWAEAYQHPPVNYATVIKAITEHLAVPNNLYFSIRDPNYKNLIEKDYEHYWSISYNCDAMFGYQDKWSSDGYLPSTDRWAQVEKEGAYTPQGGEMFTNAAMFNANTIPVGWEMLLQCYYHHQTSMSSWHGYMEAYWTDNVMQRWIDNEVVTPSKLKSKGIIFDPNWFLDESGSEIRRNPYEFIRDHLGYKIVAQDASISWSGNSDEKMSVAMNLINYGFAAAFNLESGFAILDSDGNVISEVKVGEPDKWYNRDPDDPYSSEVLIHNLSAEIDAPTEKGSYKLAFFLRNTMGQYANLSNDIERVNGFNILSSFEI